MLGREELHQLYAGIARFPVSEHIDVGGSSLVYPRLIRQQTDSLAANQIQAVTDEDTDAGSDLRLGELLSGIDLLAGYDAAATNWKEHCEQPI